MRQSLAALLDAAAADGRVSAEETLDIRRAVFGDGLVDRREADLLCALAAEKGAPEAAWAEAFVEAIGDHALGESRQIEDAAAEWLIERSRALGALEAPLLVDVLRRADSAPATLAAAARAAVLRTAGGAALSARQLDWIRTILFSVAGAGAGHVDIEEARWLFALDAASDGFDNDPAWPDLFVKAILNHVMGQRPSALLSRESQAQRRAWLLTEDDPSVPDFFGKAFKGGFSGWNARRKAPNEVEEMLAHYAARAAEAEEDERLTVEEVARIVTLARADGRRTANEERLLEAVRRIEAERAPA